jgi:hypothetical protein
VVGVALPTSRRSSGISGKITWRMGRYFVGYRKVGGIMEKILYRQGYSQHVYRRDVLIC